jgi:enoyl-CoA hydratase/carnithine racemase
VPEATVFYPVMRFGFLWQPSDPARLAALIGPARARLILMAGARATAPEALPWGLIDCILPSEALLPAAAALAADALSATPAHVAAIRRLIP